MKIYDKQKIIKEIQTMLSSSLNEKLILEYIKMLLDKTVDDKDITLNSKEIEKFLFDNETKTINKSIFESLNRLKADLKGINFDGFPINNFNFSRLENVVINIDKVPSKDLTGVYFGGVKLIGALDAATLDKTDFNGYIGEIVLNPQTINDKSIEYCKLSGVKIVGSFDGASITGTKFNGVKGDAKINPQKLKSKRLIGINFSDAELVGDFNEITKQYDKPSFKGCIIYDCEFKGLKNQITIDLNELAKDYSAKLAICDLTGVIVKGVANSNYLPRHTVSETGDVLFEDVFDDLYGSYYENEKGQTVYIHLFESRIWNNGKWKFISKKDEPNLQIKVNYLKQKKNKILSLLSNKNSKR